MANISERYHMMYPLGVTMMEDGAEILVQSDAETLSLMLYHAGETEEAAKIDFDPENRIGDVWTMSLTGYDMAEYEYGFLADGEWMVDPCARSIAGREQWGGEHTAEKIRGRMPNAAFSWDEDKHPMTPYADSLIYRLHVRGYTKHETSHVRNKGTFAGLIEMIPYLKSLNVTAVELMPITEFDEVIREEVPSQEPGGKTESVATGKLNFWGYGPSYMYAPKASYGTGRMPVELELKIMIKEFHNSGIEVIPEMCFTDESVAQVLDILHYWVQEYHVDGFRLSGSAPLDEIAADPFLKNTKLLAHHWDSALAKKSQKGGRKAPAEGPVSVRQKNLAVYNDEFQTDMRRFLRGDQGMIEAVINRTLNNPAEHAVINYMANTGSLTMMDMLMYEEKRNWDNGENNNDGAWENYSWNCGEEGSSENARVNKLRRQQYYNAFFLLLFSQGTPLINAGDEFGNTQFGNNNPYCQDNEIGWINWKQLEENLDCYQIIKLILDFRKEHKVFHADHEAKFMDYKSLGKPDVSFHGQNAWRLDTDYFRKQIGILYCGGYFPKADGTPDKDYFVAYNMHWGTHKMGLPRLEKGYIWRPLYDTSAGAVKVKDKVFAQVPPHTIVVFEATIERGFYAYDLPIGKVTLACDRGQLTELQFGRAVPDEGDGAKLIEARFEVLEEAYKQLKEYFDGERTEFDLPIWTGGTEIQEDVWAAIRQIPYGETRTYKEIAEAIGNPNASSAVSMACNRNPLPIIIPCHRVVAADGSANSYVGEVEIKEQLLALEKAEA